MTVQEAADNLRMRAFDFADARAAAEVAKVAAEQAQIAANNAKEAMREASCLLDAAVNALAEGAAQ